VAGRGIEGDFGIIIFGGLQLPSSRRRYDSKPFSANLSGPKALGEKLLPSRKANCHRLSAAPSRAAAAALLVVR